MGYEFDKILGRVADLFEMETEKLLQAQAKDLSG